MEPSLDILDLEHAIGYSGRIVQSCYLHPNSQDFLYIAGGCIVICSLSDPHQQSFLKGHDDQITCLSVSSTGRLLASGQKGDNSDVILWDFVQKKPIFRLSEHDYSVVFVAFSDDEKLLFSCGNSMDKKLFIWDTTNGYIVGSVPLLPDPILFMKWGGFVKDIKGRDTNKYQFATAGNKQLYLWKFDAKSGIFEHEYLNTGSTIREYISLDFSKNKEEFLYAGTTSGDFCVFQMKNRLLASINTVAAMGVTAVKTIMKNSLIVGCGDGTLAIYRLENGSAILIKSVNIAGKVTSLSHSEDCSQTLIGTDQGFIYRAKNSDLSLTLQCENHTNSVVFVNYPDKISDKFASCSCDETIRLWDISDYIVNSHCIAQSGGHPNCLNYNEEVIISGWQDGKIRMFRNDTSKMLWQIDNAHKGGVIHLDIAKNLKFIVSGGNEGEVRVWETKSREMLSHLKEHTNKVTKVQLISDDYFLLSSSRDRALLCWDLQKEKRVSAHYQRMGGINYFDVISDKNLVLTTGQDRKVTYWDLREANAIRSIDTGKNLKGGDECFGLMVSHDGKVFVTGGSEMVVKVWDIGMGGIIAGRTFSVREERGVERR